MLYNNNGSMFNSKGKVKIIYPAGERNIRILFDEVEQIRFAIKDIHEIIMLVQEGNNTSYETKSVHEDIWLYSCNDKYRYTVTKNILETRLYLETYKTDLDRIGNRFNEYIIHGSMPITNADRNFIRDTLIEIKEKI